MKFFDFEQAILHKIKFLTSTTHTLENDIGKNKIYVKFQHFQHVAEKTPSFSAFSAISQKTYCFSAFSAFSARETTM